MKNDDTGSKADKLIDMFNPTARIIIYAMPKSGCKRCFGRGHTGYRVDTVFKDHRSTRIPIRCRCLTKRAGELLKREGLHVDRVVILRLADTADAERVERGK